MTDKPKRPMSAYMLWLNSAREQIKSENPGMKVTDIAKKGGEIWKSMKDKSVSFVATLYTRSFFVPILINFVLFQGMGREGCFGKGAVC